MKTIPWGSVCRLNYGKALREYAKEPSENEPICVYGTNGPIGWTKQPLSPRSGLIIGRKGAYRGVHFSANPFFVIDTAYYLELLTPEIDLRWAYYNLLTVDINQMDVGAAIPTTSRDQFYALKISYPPLTEQLNVVNILSAYDQLIENNCRRIVLLEEGERQLYREWFVRLGFPGYEHTSIVNGVPDSWHKVQLGEITTKIGSGFTPRGGDSIYETAGVPLIRSQNVYDDAFHEAGLAYLSDEDAAALAGVTVEVRDILLNITGASVGRCCMAPERYVPARVNQHVMIIRVDPKKASPFLVHRAINNDEQKRLLLSYAQKGSTREALTKEMISRFEITLPTATLMRQFGEIAATYFRQREILRQENEKLRLARDLLLPRLMGRKVALVTKT